MKEYSLNGSWQLYYFEQGTREINHPDDLSALSPIPCTVPGNVELDLSAAGILPADLYRGSNIELVRDYEDYEWWYQTVFDCDDICRSGKVSLHFEGIDTLAEYWLNGEKLGESDNMFIPVDFDVTGRLAAKNRLTVRLRSACLEVYRFDYEPFETHCGWGYHTPEPQHLRKAQHMFGWDIFPRAVSAGLWKDVSLIVHDEVEITDIGYTLFNLTEESATIRFHFDSTLSRAHIREGAELEISGKCGSRTFYGRTNLLFRAGCADVTVDNPALWWPAGYGKPDLYDTTVTLYSGGKTVAQTQFQVGIRSIELRRTETTDGCNGDFRFIINNTDIMCKGSNWVPLDAFHSREQGRYAKALDMLADIGCNMVRCWGGNVYPDPCFYDFCDRHGIMVWQDFSVACHSYPQDDESAQQLAHEASVIVRRFKTHPSLILWSGDNECDYLYNSAGCDPNKNRATREVLPDIIRRYDMSRPYLPSSPFIGPEMTNLLRCTKQTPDTLLPESHLWGPRDYFKTVYYSQSNAHFISETGYFGCPSAEMLKQFIEPDHLWPNDGDPQWILHSSDHVGDDYRVQQLNKQVIQLFGSVPDNLEDFVFASQVSQAEAMKYFIERIRGGRPQKTGIIWWNLIDGWPQVSDAVVGYYYDKKLAYDYIKRSQQEFALMCSEINNWGIDLIAANDTLQARHGDYRVWDIDTGETLAQDEFDVGENQDKTLCHFPVYYSDQRWLVIEWTVDGKTSYNHYLCGYPAFDLAQYQSWLQKFEKTIG